MTAVRGGNEGPVVAITPAAPTIAPAGPANLRPSPTSAATATPLVGTERPGGDSLSIYQELAARDRPLTAVELDVLATALFWLDRPLESADAHRAAYTARLEGGSQAELALAACWVFWDHFLVGESAVAGGWLGRARKHAALAPSSAAAGWVQVAHADQCLATDDPATASRLADAAREVGRELGDRDLEAMALQTMARALVAQGNLREPAPLLDEAMVAVVAGELAPIFTGWVFCNVLATCFDLTDLRRATEWTDAANRWCEGVGAGRLYSGICRLHAAELAYLRGAWVDAESAARRACAELSAHDERYAGAAHHLLGDLRRVVGDHAGARASYLRAHELGRSPQPGLALVWAHEGQSTGAAEALARELDPGPRAPFVRSRLLSALVEVELLGATDRVDSARVAADALLALGRDVGTPYVQALAAAADGAVRLAAGEPAQAAAELRRAWSMFHGLGLPYDAALAQCRLAEAARRSGDLATAALEHQAGRAVLDRLADTSPPRSESHLTHRELEVLALVASGASNREIGERLVLSHHTVARHVSSILTKTDCRTRAGATAYAYEHRLV